MVNTLPANTPFSGGGEGGRLPFRFGGHRHQAKAWPFDLLLGLSNFNTFHAVPNFGKAGRSWKSWDAVARSKLPEQIQSNWPAEFLCPKNQSH